MSREENFLKVEIWRVKIIIYMQKIIFLYHEIIFSEKL